MMMKRKLFRRLEKRKFKDLLIMGLESLSLHDWLSTLGLWHAYYKGSVSVLQISRCDRDN